MDSAGAIRSPPIPRRRPALDAIQILVGQWLHQRHGAGRLLRDAKLYEIGAAPARSAAC